jgi:hypothetical protein
MATLSGQKVKDAFASLLKLSSNTATTTLKNVESGDGVATALQVGTTKVGVNGVLEFPTVPATGSTELDALFLNASNQVVKRTLNTGAFTGGAVTTATAPLRVSASNMTLDNPSVLSDIGTPASGDRFLIYDVSTTTWKRIDYSVLASLINPTGYQSAPEIVCRTLADMPIETTPSYLDFSNIGSTGTTSVQVGDAATYYSLQNTYGGTNTAIRFNAEGIYEITLSASLTTTGANADITFFFDVNGTVSGTSQTSFKNTGDHFLTQGTIINAAGGDVISVRVVAAASGSQLDQYTVFHVRRL